MDVRPAIIRGRKASFRVTLLNQTLAPAAISLLARDVEDSLDIRIEPEGPVIVPSGCESLVTVRVAPRAGAAGTTIHSYLLELHGVQLGREMDIDPSLLTQARFTYAPSWAPRWPLRVLAPAGVVLFAVLLLAAVTGARALKDAARGSMNAPTAVSTVSTAGGSAREPSISAFEALPIRSGRSSGYEYNLIWTTSNATRVLLNGQAAPANGSRLAPPLGYSKLYVLAAINGRKLIERQVIVPAALPSEAPMGTPPALPSEAPMGTPPALPSEAPMGTPPALPSEAPYKGLSASPLITTTVAPLPTATVAPLPTATTRPTATATTRPTATATTRPTATATTRPTAKETATVSVHPTATVVGGAVAPDILVNPLVVQFPTGATGVQTQTVHLVNLGPSPLTITTVTIIGAGADTFHTTNTCRGRAISAANGCAITITLAPTGGPGQRDATLLIADTGAHSPYRVPIHARESS